MAFAGTVIPFSALVTPITPGQRPPIRRDNINVAYILALLASIAAAQGGDADAAEDAGAKKKAILDVLGAEPRLRSKRELIEEFINAYLPTLRTEDETWAAFRKFWDGKRTEAFDAICVDEGLAPEAFSDHMAAYQFTCAEPLTDEVISTVNEPPGILRRKKVDSRIVERMVDYIELSTSTSATSTQSDRQHK